MIIKSLGCFGLCVSLALNCLAGISIFAEIMDFVLKSLLVLIASLFFILLGIAFLMVLLKLNNDLL